MANLGGTFDATQIQPDTGREPLPSGEYVCVIVDSDMRQTKDGRGQYLELVHEVVEGPYQGRKAWARLNLVNHNQTAQSIAQGQLSTICHACGVLSVQDSQQLHNRPMLVRIEFLKAGPKRDTDTNEIRGWKSVNGQPLAAGTVTAGPAPTGSPAPAAAAAGAPPWAKKAAA